LLKHLAEFKSYTREEIFEKRREKFLSIGKQKTFSVFSKSATKFFEKDSLVKLHKKISINYKIILIIVAVIFFLSILLIIK
jgi:hypothetical protein